MSAALILPLALRRHARSTPDAPAILDSGRTWTFAALDRHADVLAHGLAAAGVRAGDRVALLTAPSASAIAFIAAAGRVGVCVAPLGTSLAAPELAAAGILVGPRLVVHDEERGRGAAALGAAAVSLEALAAEVPDAPVGTVPQDPEAPAIAILTSGTTGQAKVALLSHASMAASAAAWSAALPRATGWLLCLGLAHVAGLGVAWRAIGAGVPLEVQPAFDVASVLDGLGRGTASHVSLVPAQLARLLERGAVTETRTGSDGTGAPEPGAGLPGGVPGAGSGVLERPRLRAILLGGAPIPASLVARALGAGWPVVPTYGLTEAGSGVTALVTDVAGHPGSAGRPLPGVRVRIADPAADGIGEIQVHSAASFTCYLGMPGATAAAFAADGWLLTGDAGWLDAEGYLHVVDRRDDLLVSGGENVWPAEVEAVIAGHPAVAEAGVTGRPDPTWGAVPIASIVLRPGVPAPTSAELRSFCLARLAPYKVPAAFLVVEALPRTPSGKLRRSELRAETADLPHAGTLRADLVEAPS